MFIPPVSLTQADLESAIISDPLIVAPDTPVLMVITLMSGMRKMCLSSREANGETSVLHIEAVSSCVLVVENGSLIGIFTERDVVRLSSSQLSLEGVSIADVMTHPVITLYLSEFTDLFATASLLQQHRIRHLPILNPQNRIIGLLTHESLQQLSRPIDLLRLRSVSEVMASDVICASPNASMRSVTFLMAKHRVSCVVLVEVEERAGTLFRFPVGLVTERDIVQFQALELNFEHLAAEAVMSAPVFSVQPEDSLWTVQQVMQQRLVKRLGVTGSQGELLGLVTQTSILKALNPLELYALAEDLDQKVCQLEAEKLALLQNRNAELERQVRERTAALEAKAEREKLVAAVASHIRSSLNLQEILDTTATEVRSLLNCYRAAIWRFQADWSAVVVAESIIPGAASSLGNQAQDLCFQPDWIEAYRNGRIRVVPDIYAIEMSDCHRDLLEKLQIRAKILIPIIEGDCLWGLLSVIESEVPRQWQPEETFLLQQLATQLAIAIRQATVYQTAQTELAERQRTEVILRQSEQRYASLAKAAPVGIFRTDGQGNCLYVNERWCRIAGIMPEAALGTGWMKSLHPDDRDTVIDEWYAATQKNYPFRLEYRFQRPCGSVVWVFGQAVAEQDPEGHITGYVGTITDISDRKQAEEQLRYVALHDTLTHLPNRSFLMERLAAAIDRMNRWESYRFAVLFLDMDQFKVINDSLGHFAGDQLLTTIAQKLCSIVRATDLAARLGGDEFVILLEAVERVEEAVQVAERILAEFELPLMLNGCEVVITTSIGIVLGTREYHQASDLLRDSDIAMYRAKAQGRNSYKIFDAEMHTQVLNRLNLENDLRKALEQQEFTIHYQPIVSLEDGSWVGFEALVRWQHSTRGFIPPPEFIVIAEETGLIVPLDRWMVYTACQQLVKWQTRFPRVAALKVSVNLSVQDLRRPNLVEEIDRILAETGLAGHCLNLEITESMLIENITEMIDRLAQLKMRGVQISIDDFGTGYSSLNYLHCLPADTLKIDRSFVNQMKENTRNRQVVETIITLSNQLGLAVIAEGIETEQQLQWLQQLSCEYGQGYLFSKPLTAEEIDRQLAEQPQAIVSRSLQLGYLTGPER